MKTLLSAGVLLALTFPALAQDHSAHGTAMANSPATAAYEAANAKMHEDMVMDYSGDADVDFLKSMIPHHEGAVAMARIVLEHGSDPEVRTLAEQVIAAQEEEIAVMKGLLAEKGE